MGKVGPAHPTQPRYSKYVECHDSNCFLIISNLKKRRDSIRSEKSLSRLALHLVLLSQGVYLFYPCWSRMLSNKRAEEQHLNCTDSLKPIGLDIPSKCQENLLFLKNWLLSEISYLFPFEKRTRDPRSSDVKWLSDHHLIWTIEKMWQHNDFG